MSMFSSVVPPLFLNAVYNQFSSLSIPVHPYPLDPLALKVPFKIIPPAPAMIECKSHRIPHPHLRIDPTAPSVVNKNKQSHQPSII